MDEKTTLEQTIGALIRKYGQVIVTNETKRLSRADTYSVEMPANKCGRWIAARMGVQD